MGFRNSHWKKVSVTDNQWLQLSQRSETKSTSAEKVEVLVEMVAKLETIAMNTGKTL
jgi:hypothetical protein